MDSDITIDVKIEVNSETTERAIKARESLTRILNSAFRKNGERMKISIPVSSTDDDMVVAKFIDSFIEK